VGSTLIVRSACIEYGHEFLYTVFNPNLPFSVKMIFNIRTLTTERIGFAVPPFLDTKGKE
jgi:hypothetical protein